MNDESLFEQIVLFFKNPPIHFALLNDIFFCLRTAISIDKLTMIIWNPNYVRVDHYKRRIHIGLPDENETETLWDTLYFDGYSDTEEMKQEDMLLPFKVPEQIDDISMSLF